MIDFEKISKEHEGLFPIADIESQLIKLDEEKSEAGEAYRQYIKELADVLIVCAGIYRFNPDRALREIDRVYENTEKLGMTDLVEDEVIRKWDVNKNRKWEWNGKTYHHIDEDGNE